MKLSQKGFSPIALVLAVVVLGVVGVAAWRVVSTQNNTTEQVSTQQQAAPAKTETPVQAVDNTVNEIDAIVVDDPALDQIEAELDY
jgi:cytoskeletal protein RodZ